MQLNAVSSGQYPNSAREFRGLQKCCHISLLYTEALPQENGPTICGDELADPAIMEALGCKLVQQPGNNLLAHCECFVHHMVSHAVVHGFK